VGGLYDSQIDPAGIALVVRLLKMPGFIRQCSGIKDGRVVQGLNFVDLVDAAAFSQESFATIARRADELCFLDITAGTENPALHSMMSSTRTAEVCFMPSNGGGVRAVEDIRRLLLPAPTRCRSIPPPSSGPG